MTVAVVVGSSSDLAVMRPALAVLGEFGIEHRANVVSAHRDAAAMLAFAGRASDEGIEVPQGVPVVTVAIGGATNAALLSVRILATSRPELRRALDRHRVRLRAEGERLDAEVQTELALDPGENRWT